MTDAPLPLHPCARLIVDGHAWSVDDLRRISETPVLSIDPVAVAAALLADGQRRVIGRPPLTLTEAGALADAEAPDVPGLISFTSGTTGRPKPMLQSRRSLLADKIGDGADARWLLTFEAGSHAGLQIIATVFATGGTLYAAPDSSVAELWDLALAHKVTHVSATPTFWRSVLMLDAPWPALRVATVGGEVVDASLLKALGDKAPTAHLRHIYATTEFGLLATVSDGRAGLPLRAVDGRRLKVVQGELYAITDGAPEGLPTGDLVERVNDRWMFIGRKDATVNVGGVKVQPETVETLLRSVQGVGDAWVHAVANPITGQILVADIVTTADEAPVRSAIEQALQTLPKAARPTRLRLQDRLSPDGDKLSRKSAS